MIWSLDYGDSLYEGFCFCTVIGAVLSDGHACWDILSSWEVDQYTCPSVDRRVRCWPYRSLGLGKTLMEIFNCIWNIRLVPEVWKTAHLVPVLKKGEDKTNPSSYRPISLYSVVLGSSLMESVITRRLIWSCRETGRHNLGSWHKQSAKSLHRSSPSHYGVCRNLGHRFTYQQEQGRLSPECRTKSHSWCHEDNAHQGDGEESRPGALGTQKNTSSYPDRGDLETRQQTRSYERKNTMGHRRDTVSAWPKKRSKESDKHDKWSWSIQESLNGLEPLSSLQGFGVL